jgi:aminodeoxyfutalosine synthase
LQGKIAAGDIFRMNSLKIIENKIDSGERISPEEGLFLYKKGELGFVGMLANRVRERLNSDRVYFNRNFHIEPTNICIHNCKFCSYRRRINQEGAWEMETGDIIDKIRSYSASNPTEVHIVGGVHPQRGLEYYAGLLRSIKSEFPDLHIKAFTAVELDYMIRKSKKTYPEGLSLLKEAGLGSIPGGGAEIFDEKLRAYICPDKTDSKTWLEIHEEAHKAGIKSNATMLYGHLESFEQRIDHMSRLRVLQDKTGGFQVFIPLKYRSVNNLLSGIGEVTTIEDLRNYAISRIFLDNFPHLKAYWPMIGRDTASLSLSFGVDDLDGTIEDSTRIYSMAGAEDQNPSLSTGQIVEMIRNAGRTPVERDTLYNPLKAY